MTLNFRLMYKLAWGLLLGLGLLGSCREKQLNEAILPVYEQDYLFVDAELINGRQAIVQLKRTVPPTADSTAAALVGSAQLYLYEEEQLLEQLQMIGPDRYRSLSRLELGKSYSLSVESQELGTAHTAKEQLPSPISWENLELIYNTDSSELTIKADFIEELQQRNYYAINSSLILADGRTISRQPQENPSANTSSLQYPCRIEINANRDILLSDACSQDSRLAISYQFPTRITELDSLYRPVHYPVQQIQIILRHLSFSSFEHLKSKADQHSSSSDPFMDPLPIFMNMQEGLGIFRLSSQDTLVLRVG